MYGHVAKPQWPVPYWHDSSFGRTSAEDESSRDLPALDRKRQYVSILYGVNMNTKSRTVCEFCRKLNSVTFGWLLVNIVLQFQLVYLGKSMRLAFSRGKNINLQKSKTCLYKPYFFVFKIRTPQDAMCCENLRRSQQGNSRNHI